MVYSSYNSFITGFTGSQFILPIRPAVISYTVTVQSGTAYLNNTAVIAGTQIKFGGHSTALAVAGQSPVIGCTGGYVVVNWDTVNYR